MKVVDIREMVKEQLDKPKDEAVKVAVESLMLELTGLEIRIETVVARASGTGYAIIWLRDVYAGTTVAQQEGVEAFFVNGDVDLSTEVNSYLSDNFGLNLNFQITIEQVERKEPTVGLCGCVVQEDPQKGFGSSIYAPVSSFILLISFYLFA